MIRWVPNMRDPRAPTAEEIAAGVPLDDIGDPPTGWCDGVCQCGDPCAELAAHRPCPDFAGVSSPCRCIVH